MIEQKLTGRLLAAGRALAGISHAELATASRTPLDTVLLLEASGSAWVPDTHAEALLTALETFGIVVIAESDGMGAGVRLKFTRQDTRQIARLENEGGLARQDDVP
jgi:hypothetical protein